MRKLPKHVTERYADGAHGFRADKRAIVREMRALLDELRTGCAYFPTGSGPVERIAKELAALKAALSVKAWGR